MKYLFESIAIVAAVFAFKFPETTNDKLPETTEDALNLGQNIKRNKFGKIILNQVYKSINKNHVDRNFETISTLKT